MTKTLFNNLIFILLISTNAIAADRANLGYCERGFTDWPKLGALISSQKFGDTALMLYSYSARDLNPFNIKEIYQIWPQDLADTGREGFEEEQAEILGLVPEQIRNYQESAYILINPKSAHFDPIAITGYFADDQSLSRMYLRWHGVKKEFLGLGISKWLIGQVVLQIRARHPEVTTLVELIPDIPSRAGIFKSFLKTGFQSTDILHRFDWSEYAWRELQLPLVPER